MEESVYGVVLSFVSSLVLLFGLYNTYALGKTRKAHGIWRLITVSFLTLLFYQLAEFVEHAGEMFGAASVQELEELAEGFSRTMPLLSSLIFMHLSIVIKNSLQPAVPAKGGEGPQKA